MMWLYIIITTQLLLSGGWVKSDEIVTSRPLRHSLPPQLVSVFGSQANGSCTSISGTNSNICDGTSVLNAGIIPALNGVNTTSQWADQLFTMNRSGTENIVVSFQVEGLLHNRVELAIFNCPKRGIYAPSVTVYSDSTFLPERGGTFPGFSRVANKNLSSTSCDYLLKFCVDFNGGQGGSYYNLFFPYQENSTYVFLGEVTFKNDVNQPCGAPKLIEMAVTPPPLPTSESITNGNGGPTTQSGSPTEPDTPTSPQPVRGSPVVTVIVVILVVLVLIAVLVVILIVVLLFMRKRKRQYEHDKVQQLQSVVMETKEEDKEFSNNHYDSVDKQPKNGFQSSGGVAITNVLYSDVDESKTDTYSRLREGEKREKTPQNLAVGEDQYSKLNHDQSDSTNTRLSPAPLRSPAAAEEEGGMYAVPEKKRRAETSPAIPQKSSELVEYLYATEVRHDKEAILQNSPEYSEIDRRSGSMGPVPLSNPGSHHLSGMSNNPLYHPTDVRPLHTMPPSTSAQSRGSGALEVNPIYAEPQAPNVHEPEWNPDQNIYESIYSEPLNPSLFMQEREEDGEEDLCPYSSIYAPPIVPLVDKPLSVSTGNIKEIKHLGNGNFGQVVLAKTVGLTPKDLGLDSEAPYTLVAVKKLKPSASKRNRESFDKEVKFMSRLNHPNVIRLLAVCTDEAAPYIMMEYMTNGDLNQYLNEFRSITDGTSENGNSISGSRLVYISTQIASAMQYLASQNFIHRDLASRNCLVGSKDTIKISDFGMSRSLYESSYYVISGHAILPIRWMATECFYGKFSAKSDVWAFGVTMWEIFTLAKESPFSDLEDRDIVEDAVKGLNRTQLKRPVDCPENIFSIMKKCWAHEASQRPTFDELYELLSNS